jgi:NNP family nitrate/nitrite transporter-like MFS transporter
VVAAEPARPRYQELLGLSPLAVSVMVAVPVIVGSLGRIPLGALSDRYGGRIVFAVLSFVVIAPVLFLAFATSYPALLLGGLVLGLGGASFAVGVPFVNAWFPPERRGLALGVYGMGNIGTAISGFVSPRVANSLGRPWAFLIVAVGLAVVGVAFLVLGRDAPNRPRATEPFMTRFLAAARLPIARDLAVVYAITFGGFVAFGVYLPTFLKTVYGLDTTDAATRAAGFVVLATLARPVGGTLADRVTGVPVLKWALGVVAAGAVVAAFQPNIVLATVAFLTMAAALGLANGAVFALVGTQVPAAQVGSVTGLVGAAGGLGGFPPPIVMGLVYQATGDYAIGLMLLSDVALAGLVFTAWRLGGAAPARAAGRTRWAGRAPPAGRGRPGDRGQWHEAAQPEAGQPPARRRQDAGDQPEHPEVDGGHPQWPAQLEDAGQPPVAPGAPPEHHRQQVGEGAGQGLQREPGDHRRDQPGHTPVQVDDPRAGGQRAQVAHDGDHQPGHAGPEHPGRRRVRRALPRRPHERDQGDGQSGRVGGQPGQGHQPALGGQPDRDHGQPRGQGRQ